MPAGWFVVYSFVAIQLSWGLRPFIGDPELETLFSRPHTFDNAHLAIWDMVVRAAGW